MPNVKSAMKRVRTNEKRRQRNRTAKAALKTVLKRVGTTAQGGDVEALKKATRTALSVIGKTRSKGIVNRRRASRMQSRMQKTLNKALAPAAPAAAPQTAAPAPEEPATT